MYCNYLVLKYSERMESMINISKNSKRQSGFTLIEVMVAMLLLSIGMLMLLPMMVVSMQSNNLARGFTDSSMLIKQKMEDLKNMSIPVSGADSVGTAARNWTVTDAADNLKKLVINVTWIDRDGRIRSSSMMSYMMTE